MCGRFFREEISREECSAHLGAFQPGTVSGIAASYNVAPTQAVPIIRWQEEEDQLELALAMWGLVPCWWRKPLGEKKFSTFNAKSEEAAGKASFRTAWKKRPCLVPMSGYYEWKRDKGAKQPYAIALRNRRWFYVCGLWDRAHVEDAPLDSFTILTTAANEITREIHARMPVIPEQSTAINWITAPLSEREKMIQSHDPADMHVWKVGHEVGNVKNQGKQLAMPIE